MTTAELIAACRTRLAQMREREQRASLGPWSANANDDDETVSPFIRADAQFIAHSRTDLPALLTFVAAELEDDEAEWAFGNSEGEQAIMARARITRLARALGVL